MCSNKGNPFSIYQAPFPQSVNASPPAQSLNINFAQHTQGNLFTS